MTIHLESTAFNPDGSGASGATAEAFTAGTTSPVRATTVADSTGRWQFDLADGEYDVRVTVGNNVLWWQYGDSMGVKSIYARALRAGSALYLPVYTTAERDLLALGADDAGLQIWNTTAAAQETWNGATWSASSGTSSSSPVTNAQIDSRIAPYARTAPSGQIADAQIPGGIMRDSELTATLVRTVIGLTAQQLNDFFTNASINGRVITYTQADGSIVQVTVPAAAGAMADGVVSSAALNGTTLRLTLSTGTVISVDLSALQSTSTGTGLTTGQAAKLGKIYLPNADGTFPAVTQAIWQGGGVLLRKGVDQSNVPGISIAHQIHTVTTDETFDLVAVVVDGQLDSKTYKGYVTSVGDLPATGFSNDDLWLVTDTNTWYLRTSSGWTGVHLTNYLRRHQDKAALVAVHVVHKNGLVVWLYSPEGIYLTSNFAAAGALVTTYDWLDLDGIIADAQRDVDHVESRVHVVEEQLPEGVSTVADYHDDDASKDYLRPRILNRWLASAMDRKSRYVYGKDAAVDVGTRAYVSSARRKTGSASQDGKMVSLFEHSLYFHRPDLGASVTLPHELPPSDHLVDITFGYDRLYILESGLAATHLNAYTVDATGVAVTAAPDYGFQVTAGLDAVTGLTRCELVAERTIIGGSETFLWVAQGMKLFRAARTVVHRGGAHETLAALQTGTQTITIDGTDIPLAINVGTLNEFAESLEAIVSVANSGQFSGFVCRYRAYTAGGQTETRFEIGVRDSAVLTLAGTTIEKMGLLPAASTSREVWDIYRGEPHLTGTANIAGMHYSEQDKTMYCVYTDGRVEAIDRRWYGQPDKRITRRDFSVPDLGTIYSVSTYEGNGSMTVATVEGAQRVVHELVFNPNIPIGEVKSVAKFLHRTVDITGTNYGVTAGKQSTDKWDTKTCLELYQQPFAAGDRWYIATNPRKFYFGEALYNHDDVVSVVRSDSARGDVDYQLIRAGTEVGAVTTPIKATLVGETATSRNHAYTLFKMKQSTYQMHATIIFDGRDVAAVIATAQVHLDLGGQVTLKRVGSAADDVLSVLLSSSEDRWDTIGPQQELSYYSQAFEVPDSDDRYWLAWELGPTPSRYTDLVSLKVMKYQVVFELLEVVS